MTNSLTFWRGLSFLCMGAWRYLSVCSYCPAPSFCKNVLLPLKGQQGNKHFIMKKLILLTIFLICGFLIQAQQKNDTKPAAKKLVKADSVPRFYGLKAEEITSLTIPQAKLFIKNKGITVDDYFKAKAKAKMYLNKIQMKKDGAKLKQIYDRIDKKLGTKKKNE